MRVSVEAPPRNSAELPRRTACSKSGLDSRGGAPERFNLAVNDLHRAQQQLLLHR